MTNPVKEAVKLALKRREAARKAVETKGPDGLREAALKAAATRRGERF